MYVYAVKIIDKFSEYNQDELVLSYGFFSEESTAKTKVDELNKQSVRSYEDRTAQSREELQPILELLESDFPEPSKECIKKEFNFRFNQLKEGTPDYISPYMVAKIEVT